MFTMWKDWIDRKGDIEMVEIHYTWAPMGAEPQWQRMSERRALGVLRHDPPVYRGCSIDLPDDVEGSASYVLHYFFYVIEGGRQWTTDRWQEAICARDISYLDEKGYYTQVGLQWGVGSWASPNYSLMEMDGMPPREKRMEEAGIEYSNVYELARAMALPHLFRGRVWGPRGATVFHKYHLLRVGSPNPEDDIQVWDDNQGKSWQLVI